VKFLSPAAKVEWKRSALAYLNDVYHREVKGLGLSDPRFPRAFVIGADLWSAALEEMLPLQRYISNDAARQRVCLYCGSTYPDMPVDGQCSGVRFSEVEGHDVRSTHAALQGHPADCRRAGLDGEARAERQGRAPGTLGERELPVIRGEGHGRGPVTLGCGVGGTTLKARSIRYRASAFVNNEQETSMNDTTVVLVLALVALAFAMGGDVDRRPRY
jgi:hypothetical protein